MAAQKIHAKTSRQTSQKLKISERAILQPKANHPQKFN
jgi:hypothetical protein